jgi:hypothetical protein
MSYSYTVKIPLGLQIPNRKLFSSHIRLNWACQKITHAMYINIYLFLIFIPNLFNKSGQNAKISLQYSYLNGIQPKNFLNALHLTTYPIQTRAIL